MSITKIVIRNYRGIELREAVIGPAGAIAKGKNGGGKTSLLNGLRAALEGRDIGPDAIRLGADRAEILVDTDDVSVRRAITTKDSQLTVKTAAGDLKSKPQTWLAELFGASIDPLALLLAKPKDRRAIVLASLPCAITADEIRAKWAADLPVDFDCAGHGLEVIDRVRAHYYAERTRANACAKSSRTDAQRLSDELAKHGEAPAQALSVEYATQQAADARQAVAALEAQRTQAQRAFEKTESTRTRIEELRGTWRANHVKAEAIADARRIAGERTAAVALARQALADAQRVLDAAISAENIERIHAEQLEASEQKAADAHREATSLAAVLADAGPEAVPAEALEAAHQAVVDADATLVTAKAARAHAAAHSMAEAANQAAAQFEQQADRLDKIVGALTNDAPRALMAASDGIKGLTIEGEDIALDGVRFDSLCGAQQVRFAVQVAKRANARGKVLVADGLERLDPDQFEAFVAEATADKWQLIGSRVDRGEVVIEAIQPAVQS